MGGPALRNLHSELQSGKQITLKEDPETRVLDFDDTPTAKNEGPWVWNEGEFYNYIDYCHDAHVYY